MRVKLPILIGMMIILNGCMLEMLEVLEMAGMGGLGHDGSNKEGKSKENAASKLGNTVKYQCDGGRSFYIRYDKNRTKAWVVYPDQELTEQKQSNNNKSTLYSTLYTNHTATLEVIGKDATLQDSHNFSYHNCHETPHNLN